MSKCLSSALRNCDGCPVVLHGKFRPYCSIQRSNQALKRKWLVEAATPVVGDTATTSSTGFIDTLHNCCNLLEWATHFVIVFGKLNTKSLLQSFDCCESVRLMVGIAKN